LYNILAAKESDNGFGDCGKYFNANKKLEHTPSIRTKHGDINDDYPI
jgi:hypothetical protein